MTDTEATHDDVGGDATAAPTTLKPVLDVIPEACYENPTSRGLAYFARDLVVYGLVLVGLFSTDKLYFLIPLWILSGLVVSALFVVGHDAVRNRQAQARAIGIATELERVENVLADLCGDACPVVDDTDHYAPTLTIRQHIDAAGLGGGVNCIVDQIRPDLVEFAGEATDAR